MDSKVGVENDRNRRVDRKMLWWSKVCRGPPFECIDSPGVAWARRLSVPPGPWRSRSPIPPSFPFLPFPLVLDTWAATGKLLPRSRIFGGVSPAGGGFRAPLPSPNGRPALIILKTAKPYGGVDFISLRTARPSSGGASRADEPLSAGGSVARFGPISFEGFGLRASSGGRALRRGRDFSDSSGPRHGVCFQMV